MRLQNDMIARLEEWMGRIDRADYDQYPHKLQSLLQNIRKERLLSSLIDEACVQYPLTKEEVQERLNAHYQSLLGPPLDERENVSYCWHALNSLIEEHGVEFRDCHIFYREKDRFGGRNDNLIRPIVHYLQDCLEKSGAVIYLLERYKSRTEWFLREALLRAYQATNGPNYEKILDDDLRLFLFDQGVDHPFSTPLSPTGRADIVGMLDTGDPLVVEVKLVDKDREYGRERIRKGFNQALKYTNDYGKETGFVVVFNLDPVEINFDFGDITPTTTPFFTLNHKRFYFVVINLCDFSAASKHGKPQVLTVTKEYLIHEQ